MMPWERRRIAQYVRHKFNDRGEIDPWTPKIEEVEPVPLEVTFDMELTDLDRFFLRKMRVGL